MRLIKLTQGRFAKVDDEDYDYLNQWKWCASKRGHACYAVRAERVERGKYKAVGMHRKIMGIGIKEGIDHIDGDGLNNQRSNLRFCTRSENNRNTRSREGSLSRFKGVSWHKGNKMWAAYIRSNKILKCLGYFHVESDAAIAYNNAAQKIHGEFARLNEVYEQAQA